jgi:hypothetical protein
MTNVDSTCRRIPPIANHMQDTTAMCDSKYVRLTEEANHRWSTLV